MGSNGSDGRTCFPFGKSLDGSRIFRQFHSLHSHFGITVLAIVVRSPERYLLPLLRPLNVTNAWLRSKKLFDLKSEKPNHLHHKMHSRKKWRKTSNLKTRYIFTCISFSIDHHTNAFNSVFQHTVPFHSSNERKSIRNVVALLLCQPLWRHRHCVLCVFCARFNYVLCGVKQQLNYKWTTTLEWSNAVAEMHTQHYGMEGAARNTSPNA